MNPRRRTRKRSVAGTQAKRAARRSRAKSGWRRAAPAPGPTGRVSRKTARVGVEREPGFVYFVDPDGDIARAALGVQRLGAPRKVVRLGIRRDPAYLYFIDDDGDVARVKRAIP